MAVTFAQTHLIPESELTPGAASSIRNAVIGALIDLASKELSMVKEKLLVRDIRPQADLDYTVESWSEVTGATANVYETMTTGTMADQRYVGIYGVKTSEQGKGVCSMLKINVGGGDRAIWTLHSLGEEDDYQGYCPSGIIIPQNAIYTISRWVLMVSLAFYCQLKGVVVEPRGKVVSP